MGCKRKSQLHSASEPENKRDWYQECFHVEMASPDRNDTMNEQTRGVRLQHRLMQIQEEGSKKPSKDDSNQRRFMKDDGATAFKRNTVLSGHTGIPADTWYHPMQ